MCRVINGVILLISLFDLLVGIMAASNGGGTSLSATAFAVVIAFACLAGFSAVIKNELTVVRIQHTLVAVSLPLCILAVANRRSGDDGVGMALGLVVLTLLLAVLLAVVSAILAWRANRPLR